MLTRKVLILVCCVQNFAIFAAEPEIKIGGTFRFDQTVFSEKNPPADITQRFYNGAVAPAAGLTFTAKYSEHTSFYAELDMLSSPSLGLGYLQLGEIVGKQSSLMLGQVPSPYCLEQSNSTKWVPFLQRSLAVNAFAPCVGPGANLRLWRDEFVVNAAMNQSLYGSKPSKPHDDRWGGSMRLIFKPMLTEKALIHFGGSASYQAQRDEVVFKTSEIKGRSLPELLSTKTAAGTINAKEFYVLGAEAAGRFGPLQMEADYLQTHVNRVDEPNLTFSGWTLQGNYFLSGELRGYNKETGSFIGPIAIKNPEAGAWQVALRSSAVDLNNREILGGKQLDNSVALNWYPNTYLKVTANYIHAQISPKEGADKRTVHMLGLRLQTSW